MPITQFLDDRHFDGETKRVMGLAFEMACVSLRLSGRSDPICKVIAEKIIALARDGESDANELCSRVLDSLGHPLLDPILDDPKHWQGRAEEVRTIAEQIHHPESKRALLSIARDYDRLAEHAERRAGKRSSSGSVQARGRYDKETPSPGAAQ